MEAVIPRSQPTVAEQFDDIEQQGDAAKLGMWIFLATEVLFFGGLFLSYTVYRFTYGHIFVEASRKLDVILGGTTTAVLLISSLLMALAVRAAKIEQCRTLVGLLLGTAALGLVFMSIKAVEYHNDFVEHLVPGSNFQWAGADPRNAELFFWIYFALTGIHAIPCHRRHWNIACPGTAGVARQIRKWKRQRGGDRRFVLAFCGHCLGFPLSVAVFDWTPLMRRMHELDARRWALSVGRLCHFPKRSTNCLG